jgi:titin
VWEAPDSDGGSPITGYVLEKRDTKRPGYIFVAEIDPSGPLEHKVIRLFEGSEYMFRVVAENQVGPSEPCETEKGIIAKPPYGEPTTSYSRPTL